MPQQHNKHCVMCLVFSAEPSLFVCVHVYTAAAACRTNFMALWLNGFVMIPSVNVPAMGSDYLQVRQAHQSTAFRLITTAHAWSWLPQGQGLPAGGTGGASARLAGLRCDCDAAAECS